MKRFSIVAALCALFVSIIAGGAARGLEAGGDVRVFKDGLKGPYAGFLFDSTPEIRRVDQTPLRPLAGQSVKVGAVVVSNPMKASMPVSRVDLFYKAGDGEWIKIEMLRSDGDPDYYFAYIPAQASGAAVKYYIRAENRVGGATSELPSGDGAKASVTDPDDDDSVVLKDIDVLGLEAGYDEKYFYVTLKLDGTPGKGDMAKQGAYVYFMPMIDVSAGQGAEDLFEVPLLAYAPILSSYLGVQPAGMYKLADLLKTKKSIEGSDVKMKKDEHSLSFRVNREAVSKKKDGVIGMTALTIAAKTADSLLPWEAAPYLTIYMRSHEYTVADEPRLVSFRAGAARTDITPPAGTPLCGYGDRKGAPSKGAHDPLMAQALVLDAGGEKVAIVTSDFFYIRRRMFNDIGIAMEKATGIPRDHLMISASHSHSSSGGMFPELAILGGAVSPGLYEKTIRKFVSAIVEADKKLRPAVVGTGALKAEGMNNNRREDGGPVDPTLSVLKVDGTDGKPIAIYYNFGAHPTLLGGDNRLFTPEFPGSVRKYLAKKYPGATAMFANGALGNMSPSCPGGCGGGFEGIDKMGKLLAGYIEKAVSGIKTRKEAEFTFVSNEVLMQSDYGMWSNMSGMRIGDAALVTVPGEAYVELAFPVREAAAKAGFGACFVLGITNDGIGYIIPEDWYNKHVYEATFALYGPKEGEFIGNVMLDTLKELGKGKSEDK